MIVEQIDAEFVARSHPEVLEHILSKRDLSLGSDSKDYGHDMNLCD